MTDTAADAGPDRAGFDPAGPDPARLDPARLDPAGLDPEPEGLADALAHLGLRPAGPIGTGSGGSVRSALAPDGTRWAVSVLAVRSATHGGRLQERAARLAQVDHEHLARVGAAVPLPDGRLAVLHRAVEGTDLATLLAARPHWSAGAVVTVVVPVARALAALHAQGLAHGDVAPANVVVGAGRPVLVDVLTGDDPLEQGTPGFAAPERPRGARPPGDVHALGRLGLALLAPGPTSPGQGSAVAPTGAVGDDEREAAHVERLAALLRAACDPDPTRRPDAARLAADVFAACPPEPVPVVDPAVLARLSLRRLVDDDARTVRRVPPPRGRHRRRCPAAATLGRGAAALVVVAALGTTGVIAWPAVAALGGPPGAAAARSGTVAPLELGPVGATVRLTEHRAAALLAGDPAALASVTVPGSPAAHADRVALSRLVRASGGPPGGEVRTRVDDVALVPVSGAPWAVGTSARLAGAAAGHGCREVRLVAEVRGTAPTTGPDAPRAGAPGDEVVGEVSGAQRPGEPGGEGVPAGASGGGATAVLGVCPVGGGWRVAQVTPVASA